MLSGSFGDTSFRLDSSNIILFQMLIYSGSKWACLIFYEKYNWHLNDWQNPRTHAFTFDEQNSFDQNMQSFSTN